MKLKVRTFSIVSLGILVVLSALSCSSIKDTPVSPTNLNQSEKLLPVLLTEVDQTGLPVSSSGSLGLFNLTIDADNLTADLISLRGLGSTDVVEFVDITNFLQIAPCTDCVKIKSVTLNTDDNVVLAIGIKHPFGAGDPIKPITGRNRADLHVFNIEGTLISNESGTTFPATGETSAAFKLMNPSGYSSYLSNVIDEVIATDATIFPYILHFDDYSSGNFDPSSETGFTNVTTPGPSGNLVMPMGSDYDYKDYVFDLSSGSIDLIFAVGCTYPLTTEGKATRFNPEYRVPQHNKKAASEVWVEITSGGLLAGDIISTVSLAINAVDINHGVLVGEGLDQMHADSSVSAIIIEAPGIQNGTINVDISSPTGTGHSHADPLVYSCEITNALGALEGTYSALVKVVDSYPTGENTPPLLDGIGRVGPTQNPIENSFSIIEFATYCVFYLEVGGGNEDPDANLLPAGQVISPGESILWDASGSSDSDGTITTYEFDFFLEDGDISNFTIDSTTTPPTATADSGSAYDSVANGTYYAAVRVTDNLGAKDSEIVSFDVSTSGCENTISVWDTSLPDMSFSHLYCGKLVINDQLWMIGGDYSSAIEVFDLATETWDSTPRTNMPNSRKGMGAAYLDGKIYLCGGFDNVTLQNTSIFYTIANDTWNTTYVPPFLGPGRNVTSALAYDGKIYVFGGYNWDLNPGELKDVNIYDPSTNSWSLGTDCPHRKSNPIWVVVGDRLWAGSSNSSDTTGYNTFDSYDPVSDSWTEEYTITNGRERCGMEGVVVGSKIYLVGGHLDASTPLRMVDAFDTSTLDWTILLDLPEDRSTGPGLAFFDCRLYVAGGGYNYSPYTSIRAGQF